MTRESRFKTVLLAGEVSTNLSLVSRERVVPMGTGWGPEKVWAFTTGNWKMANMLIIRSESTRNARDTCLAEAFGVMSVT